MLKFVGRFCETPTFALLSQMAWRLTQTPYNFGAKKATPEFSRSGAAGVIAPKYYCCPGGGVCFGCFRCPPSGCPRWP